MQLTTNYGFKKPDQADNVNIEDINYNMDISDEELKKINSHLGDFMNFLNNGGKIGNLTLYTDEAGFQTVQGTGTHMRFCSDGGGSLASCQIVIGNDNGQRLMRPITSQANLINIGSETYSFKDIFISGISKNPTSGYTKLPNGMILQWGEFYGSNNNIVFPIAFTTACFKVLTEGAINLTSSPCYKANVGVLSWNVAGFTASCYGYDELGVQGASSSSMKWIKTVGMANLNAKVKYLAIGY